ncbi:MAG: PilZ domain-containing protein [Proteobacteria bacterium]|nr:PilZ domain-containing protein [Pseudomonadota bacterium]
MRKYIRHPADIPIEYTLAEVVDHKKEYIKNISEGGLSFQTNKPLKEGALIRIGIPVLVPDFEVDATVAWCRKEGESYEVGVIFMSSDSEFKVRMVEQVCHIEHYRKEVLEKEGRVINGEKAALEWIKKYAKDFPS